MDMEKLLNKGKETLSNVADKAQTYDYLTEQIKIWATNQALNTGKPDLQLIKLTEEFGELAQGHLQADHDEIAETLGDLYIALTIYAMQQGLDIRECIKNATTELTSSND
ncbi:hypothetical protein [Ligilactobacillus ceti]|uniref:NTP pyrophosphohydrolase MazG putative catalytic core domain-containing protein n=1 Tax=Ligilactobacillus ceti DSM 22408 TaxID=1122146 RepID=A0A0R2KIM5_9LACO|nr:hypothetical protein [Ligilactobacillus ceti]KRN89241.1 hypothetical protein IV53_GL000154 [Ligilactobacillus ceti DSM 22408]